MFVDLGEGISKELDVTICWVWGGVLMTKEWPWKGSIPGPAELFKWNRTNTKRENWPGEEWILSSEITEEECLCHMGRKFLNKAGQPPCKTYKVFNGTSMWWISEKLTQYWIQERKRNCKYEKEIKLFLCNDTEKNPYYGIPKISKFWENMNNQRNEFWKAPDVLF